MKILKRGWGGGGGGSREKGKEETKSMPHAPVIMRCVLINFCSIEELMSLPGVGVKGADNILEMREAKEDLELEDLSQVPYLRLIHS